MRKLRKRPKDILRTNEEAYKKKVAKKDLSDEELILIMAKNPILIERPIVVKGDRAVLGRPPEKVLALTKN